MKLNRSGFMMAEVVVVSAIVLLFLATIYTSYSKLYSRYRTRLTYFDTVSLYQLAYYRDILVENKDMTRRLESIGDSGFSIYTGTPDNDKVVFVDTSKLVGDATNNLINAMDTSILNMNPTFKDYIKYLSTSTEFESHYAMLMEKCNVGNGDDCKYAYLEVYDGSETPVQVTSSGGTVPEAPELPSATGDCPGGYKVTYNANGGSGSMDYSCATYGEGFVTRPNTFTRTNYEFAGWNEKANGTGVAWGFGSSGVYENGNGAHLWTWDYQKDITLYAQWQYTGPICCAYPADGNNCTSGGERASGLCYITFYYGVCDTNIGGIYKVKNGAC